HPDREHDERAPPIASEEQAEPHVDEHDAGQADEQRGQVDEAHARTPIGPAERSPRTRLSTSSALMRHMGSPTPGTVVAPASSSPRTPRTLVLPRKIALCRSVCAGPIAPPRQDPYSRSKSAGPIVRRTTMRSAR